MKVEAPQGSEEFNAFADLFTLYKQIGNAEDTDEYWNDAVSRVEKYKNKHDTALGHKMAHALLEYLFDTPDTQRLCRWVTILACKAVNDEKLADFYITQAIDLAKTLRNKEAKK